VGFFDFLRDNPRYAATAGSVSRLNKRHRFLVQPYLADIEGSSVLDLASHDGRWSYALSAAGARSVLGIEGRAEMIAQYASYPPGPIRDRVEFVQGDVYEELPRLAAEGRRFDVVALFGLFYHVMDHYNLLKLIDRLEPRLVIIDSEFFTSADPTVRIAREKTDNNLNSIAHVPGQSRAPVGFPSRSALEVMAASLGYGVEWADWQSLPPRRRGGVQSYYGGSPAWKIRDTCALRPREAPNSPPVTGS
jgi:hypothetical protein